MSAELGSGPKRFSHQHRLAKQSDYRRVFQAAMRSADGCMTVLARSNSGGRARLGLAISRKHARRAVDRNRIKRITRESFRHHLALLHGLDIVVLARDGIAGKNNEELRAALGAHWNKLARCRHS